MNFIYVTILLIKVLKKLCIFSVQTDKEENELPWPFELEAEISDSGTEETDTSEW